MHGILGLKGMARRHASVQIGGLAIDVDDEGTPNTNMVGQ